jgi:ATP dependent DNA ligase domain
MSRLTPRLRFIEPQLPSLVDQPPEGKHWIHEVKHDGYRSQVLVERGEARVFTRNGYDWSDRYPSIVRAAAKVLRGFESQAKASRSRLLQNKPLRVARRLSRLLEKNWVHCRPRPGSAVLISVSPEADRIYGQAGDAPTLVVHSVPESLPECPSENLSEQEG